MPPVRRHLTQTTQQATTHREQAQAGSTEPHSASANRPLPEHNAHDNTRQHAPQPRTHKPAQHRTTGTPPQGKKKEGSEKKGPNKEKRKAKHVKKKTRRGGKKQKRKIQGGGAQDTPGPRHPGPENTEHQRQRRGSNEKKRSNNHKQGNPSPEGAEQRMRAPRLATGNGEAHQNAPGRPARATRPRGARTRTHAQDLGVASSDPKWAVSASTQNSPGAPAESPVESRKLPETGRVSDRVHTRKTPQRTQPKTDAGGTRQGQPHRGVLNGYDAA